MTKVRWGILSTADIGMKKVTPAIQMAENCDVVAIASRDSARAAAAAAELGIPAAYGTYEELLADDDVDAVYIPLPNDLHAEWTVKAATSGKHVLCEKPLALSAPEAEEMVSACERAGVKLAEAFMYRHHPTWVEAVRLVHNGAIGDLQGVQSWFSYYNDDPENIRNRPENGGGAIMDIGCYTINASRRLFDAEPVRISGSAGSGDGNRHPEFCSARVPWRRSSDVHVLDPIRGLPTGPHRREHRSNRDRDPVQYPTES